MKKIKMNEDFYLYLGIVLFFLMELFYYLKPLTNFEVSLMIGLRENLFPLHPILLVIAKYLNLYVLTVVIVVLLLLLKKRTITYWLLGNILFVGLCFNYLLKNLFRKERPTGLSLIQAHSFSFPSGSVLVSTLLFGGLCIVASQLINKRSYRLLFRAMMVLCILLVDLSRIYVGVHYPTDVLAATCLGFSSLLISKELMAKRTNKK